MSAGCTGSSRCAVSTQVFSTHSHWQEAFSLRRASGVPYEPGESANRAPSGAICRASAAISLSTARLTAGEVITSPHSERSSRSPPGPRPTWVCSRSRPAASDTEAASSRHARSLAASPARRRCAPGSCKDAAALLSASRASAPARPHAVSTRRPERAPRRTRL